MKCLASAIISTIITITVTIVVIIIIIIIVTVLQGARCPCEEETAGPGAGSRRGLWE